MICYYHPSETSPPPWLVGARDLVCRPDPRGGMLYGIGPSYLLGGMPEQTIEVEGGWRSWVNGAIEPERLFRNTRWCNLAPAEDLEGRVWYVPVILDAKGRRAFRVRYGTDFKPVLNGDQSRAEETASLARDLFNRLLAAKDEPSDDEQRAQGGWAAQLILLTNHISTLTLLGHELLDETLVAGTLVGATSYHVEKQDG